MQKLTPDCIPAETAAEIKNFLLIVTVVDYSFSMMRVVEAVYSTLVFHNLLRLSLFCSGTRKLIHQMLLHSFQETGPIL